VSQHRNGPASAGQPTGAGGATYYDYTGAHGHHNGGVGAGPAAFHPRGHHHHLDHQHNPHQAANMGNSPLLRDAYTGRSGQLLIHLRRQSSSPAKFKKFKNSKIQKIPGEMRQWPSIDPLLSVRVGGGMIFQSSSEFRFTLSIVLLLHLLFPSRKEEETREFVIYQLNLSHDPLLDFCFTTKKFSSPPSFFLFCFVLEGDPSHNFSSSSPLFSWEMDAESSPLLLCATLRIYEVDGWMDEVW
jgi:hypothetical protein